MCSEMAFFWIKKGLKKSTPGSISFDKCIVIKTDVSDKSSCETCKQMFWIVRRYMAYCVISVECGNLSTQAYVYIITRNLCAGNAMGIQLIGIFTLYENWKGIFLKFIIDYVFKGVLQLLLLFLIGSLVICYHGSGEKHLIGMWFQNVLYHMNSSFDFKWADHIKFGVNMINGY